MEINGVEVESIAAFDKNFEPVEDMDSEDVVVVKFNMVDGTVVIGLPASNEVNFIED